MIPHRVSARVPAPSCGGLHLEIDMHIPSPERHTAARTAPATIRRDNAQRPQAPGRGVC